MLVGRPRTSVAVLSPDGAFLYTATRGEYELVGPARTRRPSAIEVFARTPTGALRQLDGTLGCMTAVRRGGCAAVRGIGHVSALAVSPDGRSLYAAANQSDTIAVFRRGPRTGVLRQLPGRRGCLRARPGRDRCGRAKGLSNVSSLLVTADGRHLYAEALTISGRTFTAFARDSRTGALRQRPGANGCVVLGPEGGSRPCARRGTAEVQFGALDQGSDGRFIFSSSVYGLAAPVVFARDGRSGALQPVSQPCLPSCSQTRPSSAGRLVARLTVVRPTCSGPGGAPLACGHVIRQRG